MIHQILKRLTIKKVNNESNKTNTKKISINFTDRCLFRCKHCYIWERKNNYESLNLEKWKEFLTDIKEVYGENTKIETGGSGMAEINENLIPVLKFASSLGLETTYSTNGFLINRRILKRLTYECKLNYLVIGLDFISKQGHEIQRGVKHSYGHILNLFEYLKYEKNNTSVSISCIIMKPNLNELIPLIKFIHGIDYVDSITFNSLAQPLATEYDKYWYKKDKRIWPDNFKKVNSIIEKLIHMKKKGYKISNSVSQLRSFQEYYKNPNRFVKPVKGCEAEELGIQVSRQGYVKVCFNKKDLGSLKNNKFKDMMKSTGYSLLTNEISVCKINCHQTLNCRYTDD